MLLFFYIFVTLIVVIVSFTRANRGKNSAVGITFALIFLIIFGILSLAFDATLPTKTLLWIESATGVIQLGALIYTLLKTNAMCMEHGGEDHFQYTGIKSSVLSQQGYYRDEFTRCYAPFRLDGFVIPERNFEDIPLLDPNHPELRNMAFAVDQRRKNDPYAGAKIAGEEIFLNITNWLKDEKGVHAETLLAIIGALGGLECRRGIITAMKSMAGGKGEKAAGVLSIYIVTVKSGEKYLFGNRVAEEFASFYMTATDDGNIPLSFIEPLSAKCSEMCGTPEYWKTPFGEYVAFSPKGIAEKLGNRFEVTFGTYTRYPVERMFAMAIAAQKAVKMAQELMPKERAMAILAEFGWRTSHYIGTEI